MPEGTFTDGGDFNLNHTGYQVVEWNFECNENTGRKSLLGWHFEITFMFNQTLLLSAAHFTSAVPANPG